MHMMTRRAALALAMIAGPALWAGGAMAQETTDAAKPAVPDISLGSPDAKVTLIEYASFTCPHCAAFHEEVFGKLKTDYIDTGKVRFVYREFYRNRYDLWAGMIARCGGELRYYGITDILFAKQAEWAASDDPAVVVENLKRIGRTAGIEDAAMEACLNDKAMAEAMVARFQETSTADGVEGTPTLFINGVKQSNTSYQNLKPLLDAELAK